ncbi:hypothetical protein [Paenibacillus sp. DMB20]|uniref:hypothetical protein n=1 Tax=Paenibacillus sp. DMB20 TaxID=1642570 RepID=UPI0006274F93|nr:hypothetical protein [Paenibacillus sp. DMB20]KKO54239.1 hypothetical protein XI25_09330 [Paenibacillus sp. DMB20]
MKGLKALRGGPGITLQQRLAALKGRLVEINAPHTGLEPGRLEIVYKHNFIRVQGELFVPASLNSIRVFDTKPVEKGIRVGVRTTFASGSSFDRMRLVRIGSDFIEVQGKGKHPSRILFPLNKVEGIYRVK